MNGLGGTGAQQSKDCSFAAGSVAGAPLRVSWFLVILFLSQLVDAINEHQLPLWVRITQVTVNELLLLFTVLCHEMGHGTMARRCGGTIAEVLLWPFGGICFTTRGPTQDPKQSLTNELYIVAAAGLPRTDAVPDPAAELMLGEEELICTGCGALAIEDCECLKVTDVCWVVYITRLEGHLLVAVPFTAWHRLRANRALPPNTLSKVTAAVEDTDDYIEKRKKPKREDGDLSEEQPSPKRKAKAKPRRFGDNAATPEAFRGGRPDTSSLARKRLICLQVVLLGWFVLGSPSVAPRILKLGARLSAKQWSIVHNLQHLAFDSNFPINIDADLVGRGASKLETFEDSLNALRYESSSLTAGAPIGKVSKVCVSPAKAIEPDRLEFPSPPAFDPLPFLDPQTAQVYERPLAVGKTWADIHERPPAVHIRATRQNKLDLLKKLCDSGRLKPVHRDNVRSSFLSGLFAAPKNLTRDRLILDARPANMADKALQKWCKSMASAAILSDIVLEDDEILIASGEDLRDFFYQFHVGEERARRNAFADPLTLDEAAYVFGTAPAGWPEPIYCGLCALAKGDQNACEFAQCAHLALMLRAGVVEPHEMLSTQGDVPRGLMSVGVIIDDLVLLEKMLCKDFPGVESGLRRTLSDERLDKALQAYAGCKLEVNLKKEFRNQTDARFWGIELDGKKGLVRGSSLRMWPLVVITARVAMLGLCTVSLLEALAGSWVALLSVRRRLMSVMNSIIEGVAITDQTTVLRLSDVIIDELWCLVLLGSLAVSNLRAQHTPFITATDASTGWLAWRRANGSLAPEDELPAESFDARRCFEQFPAPHFVLPEMGADPLPQITCSCGRQRERASKAPERLLPCDCGAEACDASEAEGPQTGMQRTKRMDQGTL
ncbi:unnamed protein product [Durusdinium trenchii]|uniref:Uncharacterized protein n=1 Tax=Durusdinium trenchii TaxID=1381693 RepID=A0ABP0K3W7_9DINO